MQDHRSHARMVRAATPPPIPVAEPAIPVTEPGVATKNDQVRLVKAIVARCAEHQERVTIADVARRVRDETGLDFGGPTLAKYLKAHGFVRMRQGVYARSAVRS